jgi:carboxypeptidase C (cathepsin A)
LHELLRDRGLTVGRIDGRVTGPLHSGIAEEMDADPSIDLLLGPYAAAVHHYLRAELVVARASLCGAVAHGDQDWRCSRSWDVRNVTDKLERVMRANPHLQVRTEHRYYDLATHAARPGGRPPAAARRGVRSHEHAYFETGHALSRAASRRRAGITAFVRRVAARRPDGPG